MLAYSYICLMYNRLFVCEPYVLVDRTCKRVYQLSNVSILLQLETRKRIEVHLHSHITRIIRERCTDCTEFSEVFLRQGVFVCHGNPTTVTYRSTLINPFPTNVTLASYMLGIIQNWVLTGPSLTLDWLLVRVNPNCPTGIASLDVAECVYGDLPDLALHQTVRNVLNVCAVRELGDDICNL